MKPGYQAAAEKIAEIEGAALAAVDVTQAKELGETYKVKGAVR